MHGTDELVQFLLELAIQRGDADLRALSRWWALRETDADTASLIGELDDINAARTRLKELYVAGDFVDDPAAYRTLYDSYTARFADVSGRLAGIDTLPTPKQLMQPGFVESLDIDTRRELIRTLLVVACVKAGRPGIKFLPRDRLRLALKVDGQLVPVEVL